MIGTESMLRELVEHAHDLIFCLRPDGQLLYTNPAWRTSLGYAAEELEERSVFDFIHENSQDHCREVFGSMLSGTAPEQLQQVVFVTKDGRSLAAEGSCSVLFSSGSPTLIRGIYRDVTERKRLENTILDIGVRERQRIARDLHDSLGQELMGAALLATRLKSRLAERSAAESEAISEVADILSRAISTMREIVHGLYPLILEDGCLRRALEAMVGSVERIHDISCHFECEEPTIVLNDDTAMHLYYIAREAVSNAIRHASAESIVVRLTREGKRIVLRIIDDGVGIAEPQQSDGSGLRSMRYRSELIGGLLDVHAGAAGGTVVTCTVW